MIHACQESYLSKALKIDLLNMHSTLHEANVNKFVSVETEVLIDALYPSRGRYK